MTSLSISIINHLTTKNDSSINETSKPIINYNINNITCEEEKEFEKSKEEFLGIITAAQ